jgi:hypothetical protein
VISPKVQKNSYLKSGIGKGGGKSAIITSVKKKNEMNNLD